jgi:hypothetical protein
MSDTPTQTTGTSKDPLLDHCTALTQADHTAGHAFHRLEQVLGGELARLLVVALSDRDVDRPEVAA